MKILVVGDGHSNIHEVPVVNSFRKLGHLTHYLYWSEYFKSKKLFRKYLLRIQNKLLFGPSINHLNYIFLNKAISLNPDLIFIYRGTHILPNTLQKLKFNLPNCKIFGYNNDDPFSPNQSNYYWRHFISCIPLYDLVFAYRHHNLIDYKKAGARHVDILRSWFIPEINRPFFLTESEREKYECDVVFIGHFEDDNRISYLEKIVLNGYKLKLYGPPNEWNKILTKSEILKNLVPIYLIWGTDYSKAISAAKIALCFFSKLNRDTYTRRCFEIPAIGTMLLSEYSSDLSSLFKEGTEIEFFRSPDEMMNKIKIYLEDEKLRINIANNGRQRVYKDKHDVTNRMSFLLTHV